MSIVIEHCSPRDHDQIIALILGIQRDELGVPITLDDQPDLQDIPGFYRPAGGFWVARDGGEVVGTLGLIETGPTTAALRKMFVRADRRGAGFGVARQLLATLLSHALVRGLHTIVLGTRPEMHAAHRFYEKSGFVRIDEADLPAWFPRMAVDSVFYRIELSA
jgi:GNAT superfamily N-acetyltransferase